MNLRLPIVGLIVLALSLAPGAVAQSRGTNDVALGKLLVAGPHVANATFQQTVVLIVAVNPKEVAGVILNRPSKKTLAQALPTVASAAQRTDPIFMGGPVEAAHPFAILHSETALHEARHVVDDVYFTPLEPLIEMALNAQRAATGLRVFLGYSGWTRDQVERELAAGDWLIAPAKEADIFSDPAQLWPRLANPPAVHQ
ncbi:MAG TPA: YqgE/AlgH family protein [Terriglobales bacterium]|nr:YqgE/AlgH family protein [Terriglobales bacterium]